MLEEFYKDILRYALPTQLFFLLQRIKQSQNLSQNSTFSKTVINDFMPEKIQIFAKLTLNDAELNLYQKIYRYIQPRVSNPDLIIYLQAPSNTLIKRVKQRSCSFEKNTSKEYLDQLSESYALFLSVQKITHTVCK